MIQARSASEGWTYPRLRFGLVCLNCCPLNRTAVWPHSGELVLAGIRLGGPAEECRHPASPHVSGRWCTQDTTLAHAFSLALLAMASQMRTSRSPSAKVGKLGVPVQPEA